MSTLDCDLLHPSVEQEKHTCKKKTLIPNPRSEFVTLRCPSCTKGSIAFSHSNVPVTCQECGITLAYPTGGKIKLAEGVETREKPN